jgi:hypothetical protein
MRGRSMWEVIGSLEALPSERMNVVFGEPLFIPLRVGYYKKGKTSPSPLSGFLSHHEISSAYDPATHQS